MLYFARVQLDLQYSYLGRNTQNFLNILVWDTRFQQSTRFVTALYYDHVFLEKIVFSMKHDTLSTKIPRVMICECLPRCGYF